MTAPLTLDIASSDHPLDLRGASRDLWPRDTLRWHQGQATPTPDRVYWPETEAEVLQLVTWASEQRQPVVVYGAGSGVCGGARGVAGSVVLDTKRLDRIGRLDTERWTVDVQPGVIGQHLEDWLAERGFTLGHSPSSIGCSTVGGWAAARGAGQFSSRYGVFEDMVLQLRVATPGRGLVTVGEGGTAPDNWLPMFLGSEGTLGVITHLRLRVMPLPKHRWLRGFAYPDVHSAVNAMRTLMQGELWPVVLRLYDPVDTRIGGKTKPKSERVGPSPIQRITEALSAVPALRERMLSLPLSLPRLLNTLADVAAQEVLLIVGFEGDPQVVEASVAAALPILSSAGRDLGSEPGQRWYDSRHAVSYKLMPIFLGGAFADTMEVACPWSRVVPVYQAVRKAVRGHAFVMAHMSHLYPEGGSLYFSFAGDGDVATYDAMWQRALDAVLAAGGTTTHHHGVGRLKQSHATAEVGAAAGAWQALRAELDPNNVLNRELLFVRPVPAVIVDHDIEPEDGLLDVPVGSSVADRRALAAPRDIRWPWASVAGLPGWQRLAWQTTWVDVRGRIEGEPVHLGRGPRSAAGPDLRHAVVDANPNARATVSVVDPALQWMGSAIVANPWRCAHALLRADLRPAVLTVVDGRLLVGFRGPASQAFGALASAHVPGGLDALEWTNTELAAGPLVACALDDARTVHITHQGAWRPRD